MNVLLQVHSNIFSSFIFNKIKNTCLRCRRYEEIINQAMKCRFEVPDKKISISTGSFKIQPNTPSGENWTKWIFPKLLIWLSGPSTFFIFYKGKQEFIDTSYNEDRNYFDSKYVLVSWHYEGKNKEHAQIQRYTHSTHSTQDPAFIPRFDPEHQLSIWSQSGRQHRQCRQAWGVTQLLCRDIQLTMTTAGKQRVVSFIIKEKLIYCKSISLFLQLVHSCKLIYSSCKVWLLYCPLFNRTTWTRTSRTSWVNSHAQAYIQIPTMRSTSNVARVFRGTDTVLWRSQSHLSSSATLAHLSGP